MSHAIASTIPCVATAHPRAPLTQRRTGRITASAVPRRTGAAPKSPISPADAANPTASKLKHSNGSVSGSGSSGGRSRSTVARYGARSMEYSADGMGVVAHDPQLAEHEAHLKYRWKVFNETKEAIIAAEARGAFHSHC
jgi:hypothetical protein